MNKLMDEQEIKDASDIKGFTVTESERSDFYNIQGLNPIYVKLANEIKSHIDASNMNINKTKKYTNICRVGK